MAGWHTRPVGEVCEVVAGQSPPGDSYNVDETGLPFYQGKKDFTQRYIGPPTKWTDEPTKIAVPGDILMSVRAPVGPVNVATTKCCIGRGLAAIRPGGEAIADFVYYFLLASESSISGNAGAVFNSISRAGIEEIEIPLPPLEEQKRIAKILDAAFAEIDHATDRLAQCALKANQLFDSALRHAFDQAAEELLMTRSLSADSDEGVSTTANKLGKQGRGKQTRTGGRDASTRAIPGALSLSVGVTNMPSREGWTWSDLGEVARLESGHTPSRRNPGYWSGSIPWIGIRDAKKFHGGWVSDTSQRITEAGVENSSTRILPAGTVCLSRTASVGYVVIMAEDMATSQDFANWICGPDLDPEFLQFALLAEGRDLLNFASGAVHQTIYYPELKALRICHPSIDRQRSLVAELKQVRAQSDGLCRSFESKSRAVVDLRQSLLHQAFSGQL